MKKISTLICLLLITFCANNAFSQTGLKINEFDYDQPSGDTAEFIEIYNSSANAIDLSLYTIVLINGSNNTSYNTLVLPSQSLAPSGFFVICGNGGFVPNCDMVLPVYSNIVQNGAPDAMAIVEVSSGNIVDAVSYEGTVIAPYFETIGVDTTKADPGNVDFLGLSRFPDGQDSNNNNADFNLVCISPGGPNTNTATTCGVGIPVIQKTAKLISVFPNPSNGYVIVDFSSMKTKDATITLNNVLGEQIKTMNVTTPNSFCSLSLADFQDGIYYVTVKTNTATSTQRLILHR